MQFFEAFTGRNFSAAIKNYRLFILIVKRKLLKVKRRKIYLIFPMRGNRFIDCRKSFSVCGMMSGNCGTTFRSN
jgi:hypothetical protein